MTAVDVRVCSLADLELEPESVDAVITDPPYAREHLGTWTELGAFADRVLRPGGSLIAMSGQSHLNDVMRRLDQAEGLRYWWTLACLTPGGSVRVWHRHVLPQWKPMLWYVKGKKLDAGKPRFVQDTVLSVNDKRFHHWGQALSVFQTLCFDYSKIGELVCDPFVGGGTTAAAALLTDRRFVGCDIDADAVRMTEARLAAVQEYLAANRARILAS